MSSSNLKFEGPPRKKIKFIAKWQVFSVLFGFAFDFAILYGAYSTEGTKSYVLWAVGVLFLGMNIYEAYNFTKQCRAQKKLMINGFFLTGHVVSLIPHFSSVDVQVAFKFQGKDHKEYSRCYKNWKDLTQGQTIDILVNPDLPADYFPMDHSYYKLS